MEMEQEPKRLAITARMPLFGIILGSISLAAGIETLIFHSLQQVFSIVFILFGLLFLVQFTRFSRLVIDQETGTITRTTFNPGGILKRSKSIKISEVTELRHGFSGGRYGTSVTFYFNNGADTLLSFDTARPHYTGKSRLFGIKNSEQDVIALALARFMNLPLIKLHLNSSLPEDDPISAKHTN